jgi:hypothetical protein
MSEAKKTERAASAILPVQLKFPITNGLGQKIDTITLRRGVLKDLKQAQRNADGNAGDVDTWLVSILAEEKLVFEDVERLDLADWAEVQARLQGLL